MSTDLLQVAIIGSGPAGYYTAEALAESIHAVSVDVIDRLPTPFGLIRTGVAPDHQSIKNVTKRYDQTASRDDVRFVGNLSIGRDVSVAELLDLYDAVVLATGALQDRKLGIPGEDLAGVRGSADIVGWYNTHPDYVALTPELNTPSVVIIGNGNVAIDVARVLAKTEARWQDRIFLRRPKMPFPGCPCAPSGFSGGVARWMPALRPRSWGKWDAWNALFLWLIRPICPPWTVMRIWSPNSAKCWPPYGDLATIRRRRNRFRCISAFMPGQWKFLAMIGWTVF
ncbi:FAD-dependent oxidoreductase [Iodidimonas gelatinilytica]|uniref:FAD-dependent oxidoreductase n=1 Tax=Iodidimonas gelatinilytica TaxID=1236966 RepID=UPI001B2FEDB5|nr:FAD-dependent oxidoreductase [Iodidimonas gelatinilytica]